ncbi:MAG: hypothetical protein AAF648_13900 [Pseudomonadota bacterium]
MMHRSSLLRLVVLMLAPWLAGCTATNYDFQPLDAQSPSARLATLVRDLTTEQELGDDDALYRLRLLPLTHLHLKVFEESTDRALPVGYTEADIAAYLPLFGLVHGRLDRYSRDRDRYEQHRFSSVLWGLVGSVPSGTADHHRRSA